MERFEDITELLGAAAGYIKKIQEGYERAKGDEEAVAVSRVEIKACLECLRSSLEYSAQDIWVAYTKKKNSVYFPYGKTEEDFNRSVKRNLPAVQDQFHEVYELIESLQAYKCGSDWLVWLCSSSNFNKHDRLSKQVRRNSINSTTNFGGVVAITGPGKAIFNNCYINGVPMSPTGQFVLSSERSIADMKNDAPGISLTRTFDWVEFELEGKPGDVIQKLLESHAQIVSFTESVRIKIRERSARAIESII